MKNRPKVRFLNPMLPVEDMSGSIKYFVDLLQFDIFTNTPNCPILSWKTDSIHLQGTSDLTSIEPIKNHQSIYIGIVVFKAYWIHVKKYNELYKMRETLEREYGMRAFH